VYELPVSSSTDNNSSGGGSSSDGGGGSSSGGGGSSSGGGSSRRGRRSRRGGGGRRQLPTTEEFELLPAGAKIHWDRCTFRGQFYTRASCQGGATDPQRWPPLMNLVKEVALLQVPGATAQRVDKALEK
jgi:hypothetical protein